MKSYYPSYTPYKTVKWLLFICCIIYFPSIKAQKQKTPNILLIIADDLGIDALHSNDYGISVNSSAITPNLDMLKNTGVTFKNTWATPQCTTTRASIMSGKYGINSGVRNVPGHLETSQESILNYLNNKSQTDYAKAVIGKWHISNPVDVNHPYDHGADYYQGIISGTIDDYYSWDKVDENGNTVKIDEYVTKHLTDLANNWIDQQNKPWFLWLAHIAPHSPFQIPPQGTYTRTDTSSKRGTYLASIESLDYYIGELLDNMSQGTRENTVVIFIGDNGTPNGVARYFPTGHGKASMYEGGLRVPMIISGKNVSRQNQIEQGLVQVNDIYATVAQLTGSELNGGIYNSYGLKEALTSSDKITRPYIYSDYIDDGVEYWAIRDKDYKLIENENGDIEFYNISNDNLTETDNLIDNLNEQETIIFNNLKQEAQTIRTSWSCQDQILNGTENSIDDCNTNDDTSQEEEEEEESCAVEDELSFSNIGCCDAPNQPTVYYEYYENNLRKIYTNNYPDHDFCYSNPSKTPTPSYHKLQVDMTPQITQTTTSIVNPNTGRPATTFGVALNGVMIAPAPALPFVFQNPQTNQYNWDWVFEPTNNQGQGSDYVSLDCASAHTSTAHGYHYHGEMFSYLENETPGITQSNGTSELFQVGWAADGFPIIYKFGPDKTGNIKKLTSSYKLKEGLRPGDGISEPCGTYTGKYTNDYEYQEGFGDLDACNGIEASITLETAKGEETFNYFYVVTSEFPQVSRCLVGNVDPSFSQSKITTEVDQDGDGFIASIDCDDNDPNIHPNAEDDVEEGIDKNCDRQVTLSLVEHNHHHQHNTDIHIMNNPTSNYIELDAQPSNYEAVLYDLKGNKILEEKNNPKSIAVTHLTDGVYLLKITNHQTNQVHIQRIVKK